MTRKRHSLPEIAAKLQRADQMAADGMLQNDIARALGVSVMTYHRWRTSRSVSDQVQTDRVPLTEPRDFRPIDPQDGRERPAELDRLRIENARLKRLLTDLLLEKARLEELLQGPMTAH